MTNINTKEYWDKRWSEEPMLSRKVENAVCKLVTEKCSVLDIGCGSGRILRSLKKDLDCSVYGIDISSVAINQLRSRGIPGACFNVEEPIVLVDFVFDVVILCHTLEHIQDDQRLIRYVAEMTKKYLIVAVPNDCIGPDEEPEHIRKYTKESLKELLYPHFDRVEDHSTGIHLILKAYVANS